MTLWGIPHEVAPADGGVDTSRTVATRARLNILAIALEARCRRAGGYPIDLAELLVFAAAFQCPITEASLRDAWGHPFYYALVESVPDALSAGPDELFSTKDDISFGKLAIPGDLDVDRFCKESG